MVDWKSWTKLRQLWSGFLRGLEVGTANHGLSWLIIIFAINLAIFWYSMGIHGMQHSMYIALAMIIAIVESNIYIYIMYM